MSATILTKQTLRNLDCFHYVQNDDSKFLAKVIQSEKKLHNFKGIATTQHDAWLHYYIFRHGNVHDRR